MMKKIISFILIIAMLCITFTGCSAKQGKADASMIEPTASTPKQELRIVVDGKRFDGATLGSAFFQDYLHKFQKSYGVKVTIIDIGTKISSDLTGWDEHVKWNREICALLNQKNGTDLVAAGGRYAGDLIEKNLVVKCYNQIPNSRNIYYGLSDEKECYVPIWIGGSSKMMRKKALAETLGKLPNLGWSRQEYYETYFKWLGNSGRELSYFDISALFSFTFDADFVTRNIPDIKLETKKIKDSIMQARKLMFSSTVKYKKSYKLKNYMNLMLNETSKEFNDSMTHYFGNTESKNNWLEDVNTEFDLGLLRVQKVDAAMKAGEYFAQPDPEYNNSIFPWGLMISKNANNPQLAEAFINGLLSDEVQFSIFEKGTYKRGYGCPFPVVDTIEKRILNVERASIVNADAFKLKELVLHQLKTKKLNTVVNWNEKYAEINVSLFRDWVNIVFADDFKEGELGPKLRDLEIKYKNILKK